jgi:hypothetical protein
MDNTINEQAKTDRELNFDNVEFTDVPEPLVPAYMPMQED